MFAIIPNGSFLTNTMCQVLSFPPSISPTKVLIVPLSKNEEFSPIARKLGQKLRSLGISSRVDDSGATIGKRYSRNDELGTSFGITIDFQTVKDGSVTLRERDSTNQVRADEGRILEAVQSMVNGNKVWSDIESELPKFEGQELEIRES